MVARIRVATRFVIVVTALVYLFVIGVLHSTLLLNSDNVAQRQRLTLETSTLFDRARRNRTSLNFQRPISNTTSSFTLTNLPPSHERAPNFLVIGTQKGGTRSLNAYLSQHTMIQFPTDYYEPHFFDRWYNDGLSGRENLEIYLDRYFERDCRDEPCIAGEGTPSYLYDAPIVPLRLKQACPWCKLIVLLRDPVKRAFSQHNMLVELEKTNDSFEEYLKKDLKWMKLVGLYGNNITLSKPDEELAWLKYLWHSNWDKLILGRGMYAIQLEAWFRYFPRNQFLILKSTDLDNDREATMRRIHNFLGIPHQSLDLDEKVHVRNYTERMSPEIETWVYDFYRPYNERLEQLLGPEWKKVFEQESKM